MVHDNQSPAEIFCFVLGFFKLLMKKATIVEYH